jgi:hypothetical protein
MESKSMKKQLENNAEHLAKRYSTAERKKEAFHNQDYDESYYLLNPEQRSFVDNYLRCGEAKKSAILAGYSPKTAGAKGIDLLKDERIDAILKHKRKEMASVARISREKIIIDLEAARIRAAEEKDDVKLLQFSKEINAMMDNYAKEGDNGVSEILRTGKINLTFAEKGFNPNKPIRDKTNPFSKEEIDSNKDNDSTIDIEESGDSTD